MCHCCWLFTIFSDAFSHSPSKYWPLYKHIFHFQWVIKVHRYQQLKILVVYCLENVKIPLSDWKFTGLIPCHVSFYHVCLFYNQGIWFKNFSLSIQKKLHKYFHLSLPLEASKQKIHITQSTWRVSSQLLSREFPNTRIHLNKILIQF